MNFDQAIQAHVQWKSKLGAYLAKPDRSLSAATASDSQSCELGKWMQGDGRAYSANPDFVTLQREHAKFHKAAGDVIRKADAGLQVNEVIALGAQSEYAMASNAVVSALMKLRKIVKAA